MGTGAGSGASDPMGGALISVADAVDMVARFRGANLGKAVVRYWSFGRTSIDAVLAQKGCAGLRIYRGVDDSGTEHVLLVGTDAKGADLLPTTRDQAGTVADRGWPCPPICAATSLLNP